MNIDARLPIPVLANPQVASIIMAIYDMGFFVCVIEHGSETDTSENPAGIMCKVVLMENPALLGKRKVSVFVGHLCRNRIHTENIHVGNQGQAHLRGALCLGVE
jgi:hypothetical protein